MGQYDVGGLMTAGQVRYEKGIEMLMFQLEFQSRGLLAYSPLSLSHKQASTQAFYCFHCCLVTIFQRSRQAIDTPATKLRFISSVQALAWTEEMTRNFVAGVSIARRLRWKMVTKQQ